MSQTWFITGVSRGLGHALASVLLAGGDTVVGTTRSGTAQLDPGAGTLHVLGLDVSEPDGPARTVDAALRRVERLDVVVNNAGYGLLGAVEESSEAETDAAVDTNLLGPLRLVRAALPHLRANGSGHIVNVSSIAALAPLPGSAVYAAAKAGLSAVSEGLAAELEPLGIGVTAVEPGAFRTDFLSDDSIRRTALRIPAYRSTSGAANDRLAGVAGRQAGDPRKAAQLIVDAVRSPEPPRHLVLGADAVDRTRENVGRLLADVDAWAQRSRATAHEDAAGR